MRADALRGSAAKSWLPGMGVSLAHALQQRGTSAEERAFARHRSSAGPPSSAACGAALETCMDMDPERTRPEAESPRATMLRFAAYLAQQEAALTEQWLLTVRRDPQIAAADRLTHQQLVDHLPDL